MKFRTEIRIRPFDPPIGHRTPILSLGSCFAETIASRLAEARFRVTANPTGVLFNPLSIARTLRRFAAGEEVRRCELHPSHGLWFHYDFHGSFSGPSPETALQAMNVASQAGHAALLRSEYVMATFGTAWVYERTDTGDAVANCHRQPQALFRRRLLEPEEIAAEWSELLAGPLAGKRVVLTISPVRHLADGLEGNSLSKSVLRLAVERIAGAFPTVRYFPAYEILLDDLRDYRFYADDLVHPSQQAQQYIWELFTAATLTEEALRKLPQVEAVTTAAGHRPLHPESDEYRRFCRKQLEIIESLPEIDLSREKEFFNQFL